MQTLGIKEAEKESMVKDLSDQLQELNDGSKKQLKAKDDKLNSIMEELANLTAMYNENLTDLDQIKQDQEELTELRELKREIESREQEQAAVIEQQAKRLEGMEQEYKEEQVMRKR